MSTGAARLIGFLILSQAMFLASTFGQWLPVGLATMLAGVIVYGRRSRFVKGSPEQTSTWFRRLVRRLGVVSMFVAIVAITSAWRIGNQLGESINAVYVGSDILAHAAFFSSLAVWALRPIKAHVSMLPLGLVVVLLCVAAGGASLSLAAQTTVALAACVGFSLASQIILGAAQGTEGAVFVHDRRLGGKAGWMGPLISLITLSILMMATSAIAKGTASVLPRVQELLQAQLQSSFDRVQDDAIIGGSRYVRGSRLGSIRRHLLADPQAVALRIYSEFAPGYLRGSAFDQYQNSRWMSAGPSGFSRFSRIRRVASMRDRAIPPEGTGTVELEQPLARPLLRFPLVDSTSSNLVTLEIHNDPLKGPVVFLPMTTRWIEARSRELLVSSHGVVRLGVDPTKPYVAGVSMSAVQEELEIERRNILLDVPSSVSPQASRLADEICAPLSSTRAKAQGISEYFQSEFGYSLATIDVPSDVDPLAHFLNIKHDAHCEYFATATVMVLRTAGVPAHYVTGYVADEFSDEESSWLARQRDAHAWVEAYDEASKEWFPVESTPGRRYHTVEPTGRAAASESFFDVFRMDDDEDNDTMLSRAIGWLMSIRATDPLLLLGQIAQLPLFCVLVFLLWTKYIRPARGDVNSVDAQSRKMLRRVERRLRKHSLVRLPSETLYQFADRIDGRRSDTKSPLRPDVQDRLAEVSRWYREYANARYQGKLPAPLSS